MKENSILRSILSLALAVAVVATLGTGLTHAQTTPAVPVAMTDNLNTFDYEGVPFFSSDWRTLAAGDVNSFSFEYSGRNRPVMVWMEISTVGTTTLDLSASDSIGFEIWTPELWALQADGEDGSPVGIGRQLRTETVDDASATRIDARLVTGVAVVEDDDADESEADESEADESEADESEADESEVEAVITDGSLELFWYANLPAPESFVVVINGDVSENLRYMVTISGPGLILPPGVQTVAPATTTTVQTPAPTVVNVVPAPVVDNNTAIVLATFLNVREGPSLEFPIITTAPLGMQLVVVGGDNTDTWLAVQLQGERIGWVSRGLTTFTGEVEIIEEPVLSTQPVAPVVAAEPTPVAGDVATIVALEVNVRQGPTVDYPIITSINEGVVVTVVGRTEDNTWIQIDLGDGRIGWVDRTLTDFEGLVAVVEAPPLVEVITPGVGGTDEIDPNIAFVTALALNMRQGPGTGFAVITTLDQGAPLTVLGRNAANNWLLVETEDDIQGWVSRAFTNFVEIVEVVEADVAIEVSPGLGGLIQPTANIAGITSFTVNMRQGPGVNFPVITTLSQGSVVGVVGRNTANSWLLVQNEDGIQGWIARGLTNFIGVAPVLQTPPLPETPATPETPAEDVAELPGDEEDLDAPPVEEGLSDNWFLLTEETTHWFRFDHGGDDNPIHVWMEADPSEGAGFRVFDEETARAIMDGANPDDFSAIGRGTPNPNEPGDLFWRGTFVEAGVFYVMVEHGWEGEIRYAIYAAGPGLQ